MRNNEDDLTVEHEGGNFGAGFMLGIVAGFAGMFLFGTKKGKKTVSQLSKWWVKVQPQVEEGLAATENGLKKSDRPFFQAVGEIVEYVADHLESEKAKGRGRSSSKSLTPASKDKKRTFFKK